MKEKQWTSKENDGKPKKIQGKWRKTNGEHKEQLAKTKFQEKSQT